MFGVFTLLLSLLMAASSADVVVATIRPKSDVTMPLGASGKATLKREPTVTSIKIELDRVPLPSTFGPAFNTYVAWAISPEGNFENIGEIGLDKDSGRLDATTRFEQVGVLITAEPHYMVDSPSSAVAFRTQLPKSNDFRRVTVSVVIGTTDYSSLQLPAQAGVPTLISESRAAFQIAKNAEADRFAEAEFRQAKVALDTMEQMLSRASPLEIMSQSANETIRRSEQALIITRERRSAVALEAARGEADVLRQEKQNLDSRVQQLAGQQDAAAAQLQKLQGDLTAANRERQQAVTHDVAVTKELSDVKRKQDELQARLVLPLRDEFFDSQAAALTPAGRDALAHLCGIAEAVPGQVRLDGPAPDALFEAARQYLIQAGVSPDRIILKR